MTRANKYVRKGGRALLCTCALSGAISRAAEPALFPFVLPWDDASAGVTNVSALRQMPAGGHGFLSVKDGHLYEGGKRFRIFGVNTVFGASFPTHADAEKVAARMARFGINCVRLHHMDMRPAPNGIWSADMQTLDPGQLDKLDYFVGQLKKNGIYIDINLHVSRSYPGMPKWQGMPGFFKGVDNFYPPMIQMQRDYARQLLTHVNPYTNNAYIDEPAVAIIEINNENGFINEWWNGALDGMSEAYQRELDSQWNQWLQSKYPARSALAHTWNASEELPGPELLKEPAFENGSGSIWRLEQLGAAKASAARGDTGLRVTVAQPDGVGWHIQLSQGGIPFSRDNHYTISFRARSDAPRRITVNAAQTHSPWNLLWSTNVQLTPEWKDYRFTFQPSADDHDARIIFSNLGDARGNYELAAASLTTGGVFGLKSEENPGSIPAFGKADFGSRCTAAQRDWMRFLYDTETRYWTGMETFLKQDLKAHGLIVGTPTGYSPPTIQAKMDVLDTHGYWQHPRFPHKSWDPVDWTVNNIPMAAAQDGALFPGMAGRRVAGKPYICTEFNEPAPNTHASEGILLLSAYAALQDWDGVFIFAYSQGLNNWNSQHISSFFDIDQDPNKMATLPAAVSMFVRGDVSSAAKIVAIPLTWDSAIDASLHFGTWWAATAFGTDKMLTLQSRVVFDLSGRGPSIIAAPAAPERAIAKSIVSDTGQLAWDSTMGRVTVDTPESKAFIGSITGGPVKLGGVTIEPRSNSQNWAVITVTDAMSRDGAANPARFFITATGYEENTGMLWTSAEHNSVGNHWGIAPSLVEGIRARITFAPSIGGAARVSAWALDTRGQRKAPVKVIQTRDGMALDVGPEYQTLWYEVDIPKEPAAFASAETTP